MSELIEKFSLEAVGKSAGVFNPEKLLWLNAHYIKHGDSQRLGELLTGHLVEKGIDVSGGPAPAAVVDALKERAKTLLEMTEQATCYYRSEVVFDPEAVAKFLVPALRQAFENLLRRMEEEGDWLESNLERAFEDVLHQAGLKFGKLAQPVRVALTGGSAGPGICQIMVLIGKERTLARLRKAILMLS